jgi:hypothetical protein
MPDLEMKEDLLGLENREKSKSDCDASAPSICDRRLISCL